jgi:hypothetical protein
MVERFCSSDRQGDWSKSFKGIGYQTLGCFYVGDGNAGTTFERR